MSTNDGSGGGATGVAVPTGESQQLKIIKTQLVPHSMSLQQQQHLPQLQTPSSNAQQQQSLSSSGTTVLTSTQSVSVAPGASLATHTLPMHLSAHSTPIQLTKSSNLISLNPVAAKITHVKTTTLDASGGALATAGAIKVGNAGAVATSIALNSAQSSTATAIRAINAGGQSTQVRVVMPTGIVPPSMIKQLEGAAAGRTQITAIPATAARTVSNTSITVTRPVTQTYLPRAAVTANQMTAVGVATGQRLVTPIRTAPAAGTTVTGLTAAGSFVRGTAVSRSTASSATTVISPATSTTWMAANTGQVQLIRAIPHQSRQRIITTTQGLAGAAGTTVSSVGGAVVASAGAVQTIAGQSQQTQGTTATIQAVSAQSTVHNQQQQQTYVATLATVLPQRHHQATLVYSSNAATTQPLAQVQQFNPSVATAQRFAVATPLNTAGCATGASRQVRPILGKPFSAAKLNTTSISIRAPNLPQLTPTLGGATIAGVAGTLTSQARSNTVAGTAASNIIPTANLPTTRIIQLQQQPGGATQQLIGSAGRLASNVMLQPIIVNATASGKLGLRPPVTMAGKVQPSLTITQLGIGKLPSGAGAVATTVGGQNVSASLQAIGSSVANDGTLVINTPTASVATSLTTAASQLIAAQNIVSSASGATVVPLAITTRGGTGGNILTGTITPIKNAIAVGKLMAQPTQLSSADGSATNLYIHHATSAGQRATHNSSSTTVTLATSTPSATTTGGVSGGNTVLSSACVTTNASAFLPQGIYYESVPASCSGVLSLSTTTVTSSTVSQSQIASSAASLAITSVPFATHAGSSTATFTVVPSGGVRAIGQLQLPKASVGGTQIQAVPVRFSAQLATTSNSGSTSATLDTVSVSQAASAQSAAGTQLLIPATHQGGTPTNTVTAQGQQQQHMVIPLHTSIKVTAAGGTNSTIVSNFLRKRDVEGLPLRAAKNLGPTIFCMAPANITSTASSSSPAQSVASVAPSSTLTIETLAKKDRVAGTPAVPLRGESPASSDGSTTVSANSSPGVDQQIRDGNLVLNRTSDANHFNPINELYANHHSMSTQHNVGATPTAPRNPILEQQQRQAGSVSLQQQRVNGGAVEYPPRKKSRRLTSNDSQHSSQSQLSFTLPPPSGSAHATGAASSAAAASSDATPSAVGVVAVAGNKENAKPLELVLRRPSNCTLLTGYKQNWKPANNHFQRHTDVKPREERRPTVIDLANQANVLGKINGWKIHHLRSQMQDLSENEALGYERLSKMLQQVEKFENGPETECISELLKGNMQRSKIIVDGVNEAQNQIMKIFDHKSHISDIIHRCASKRNFKKREKI